MFIVVYCKMPIFPVSCCGIPIFPVMLPSMRTQCFLFPDVRYSYFLLPSVRSKLSLGKQNAWLMPGRSRTLPLLREAMPCSVAVSHGFGTHKVTALPGLNLHL